MLLLLIYATAGILHANSDHVLLRCLFEIGADSNRAKFGKPDGFADQIVDDLPQAFGVRLHNRRNL